ncbi:hypothetical protein D3C77_446050 [compost metagenome]
MPIGIIKLLEMVDIQHGDDIIHAQLHHILLQSPPRWQACKLIRKCHRIRILDDRSYQYNARNGKEHSVHHRVAVLVQHIEQGA